MQHCSTSRLHATDGAEYQEENTSMDYSTLMTAQMRWEEKRVSTNCLRATVKHQQTKVKSNNDGVKQAILYQHALQRHGRPMQWHDLVTFMLALSAFDVCPFLWNGQSRKVFYTDKVFFFFEIHMYMSWIVFHRAVGRAVCCISAGLTPKMIVRSCNALTEVVW